MLRGHLYEYADVLFVYEGGRRKEGTFVSGNYEAVNVHEAPYFPILISA